jgi:hypothetical protein
MHGMSMMPGNGGGGGGDGDRPKRPRRMTQPSGQTAALPADEEGNPTPVIARPMPVVLTIGTIVKLASIIVIPLLGAISAGIYFFHKTNAHIEDPVIHLTRGERHKLETKVEAKKARSKLEKSITREVKLQARELKQHLLEKQKTQFDRILTEVKRARRDIKNQ